MDQARHDAWSAGESYDQYMGRWSKRIAARFLEWLAPRPGLDWLEVGCGTGALASEIVARCNPRAVVAVDSSEDFIETARRNVADERVVFRLGDALDLPLEDGSRDVVASALFLNFVADKGKALEEMVRVARPGGRIGFYVWDYPGGGVEFMSRFWQAAMSLDRNAADYVEGKRFAFCTPDGLTGLAKDSGLQAIECSAIEVPTKFRDFEDFWRPFTLGTGPAPGYCMSLSEDARRSLRDKLDAETLRSDGGSIELRARAWALKAKAG